MHVLQRAALLAAALFPGFLLARPVVLESTSVISAPDPAYAGGFGFEVAVNGDYAFVSGYRYVPSPDGDNNNDQHFQTFWLFRRDGLRWVVVQQFPERVQLGFDYIRPAAAAAQNGIAALRTGGAMAFYELGPTGWTQAPAENVGSDAPDRWMRIDAGRVIVGEGSCGRNGRVFARDATGTWRTQALLVGVPRSDGCDDEFDGDAVDISGNFAVVNQPNPEDGIKRAFIFRDYGGTQGWYLNPYSEARPPAENARDPLYPFGNDVAFHGPNVIVSGGLDTGSFVYRETPAFGFNIEDRIQTVDGFTGGNAAYFYGRDGSFLLYNAYSYDRRAQVVHVFRRDANNAYEHVAILAGRNGESLGTSIGISGRRVIVPSSSGDLEYFELPASFVTPARLQDTFEDGNSTGWTPSAGSSYAVATVAGSRALRQSNTTLTTRAVLAGSDFRSQAIEADLRFTAFGASGAGAGLTTRYQAAGNWFDVVVRNTGRVELRRSAGGTLRVLASAAFSAAIGRTYRVRLESVGTLHRVSIDGRLLLDFDIGGATHGFAALYTDRASAEFDNVVVTPSLTATIYETDFSSNGNQADPGFWTRTGLGFWNFWTGESTLWNQSSILGDARASIGTPTDDQIVRVRARPDTFATPSGTQARRFGPIAPPLHARPGCWT